MQLAHASKIQKEPSDLVVSDIKTVVMLDQDYAITYLRLGTDGNGGVVARMGSANDNNTLDMYMDRDTISAVLDWLMKAGK